jgi:DNA-directed RNA polymerase subunit L|tara:strand:+ start:3303 stop:3821 length:519 start_codon:yes stop_codon:yes gene_type:complete
MVLERSRRIIMEVKFLRDENTELEIEIKGEDHTLCNALTSALRSNKNVITAVYKIEHPLLGYPKIYIKTKNIKFPKKKDKEIPLKEIHGIGPKREEQLKKSDIITANKIREMDIEKVHEISGIPKKTLMGYMETANTLDYGRDTPARHIMRDSVKELTKTFSDIKVLLIEAS